jgi:hypothetical protein
VVGEGAHVGGRTIVCADEIVRGEEPMRPRRTAALHSAELRRSGFS